MQNSKKSKCYYNTYIVISCVLILAAGVIFGYKNHKQINFWFFVYGLLMSFVLAHIVLKCISDYVDKKIDTASNANFGGTFLYPTTKSLPKLGIEAGDLGHIERLFFTVLVAYDPSVVAVPMLMWAGMKVVHNWYRQKMLPPKLGSARALKSIVLTLLSMTFAFLGGLLIRLALT